MEAKTVTAWLEARKLVLDVGNRFAKRIQYYMTIYLIVVAIGLGLSFICFSGYLNWKIITIV